MGPKRFTLEARVRVFLSLVLGLLCWNLATGDSPFSTGAWERLEIGERVHPDDALPFVWIASLINAVVVATLLASAPLWLRGRAGPPSEAFEPGLRRMSWVQRASVLGACLVLLGLAWPRLSHSFYGDEVMTTTRSVHGYYERVGEDDLRFQKVKWRETLWAYRQPNNHVFYSVLARVTTKAYVALADPPPLRVEPGVRFPALLAGVGACAVAALLCRRLGFAWAGVAAAWILALHPWLLRYASEARGYSLILLLGPLQLLTALSALHKGSWPAWLSLGAVELLMLWTIPSSFVWVAATEVIILPNLLRSGRPAAERSVQLKRWLVAHVCAAAAFLQLFLPNLVQAPAYLRYSLSGEMGTVWWADLAGHLIGGTGYGGPPVDMASPDVADLMAAQPLGWIVVLAASILLAAGAYRLLRSGRPGVLCSLVLLAYVPASWYWAASNGTYLYVRFLILALVAAALLVSIGGAGALRGVGSLTTDPHRSRRALAMLLMALLIGGMAWVAHPVGHALRDRSLHPSREAIESVRPSLDPLDPAQRGIATLALYDWDGFYDPWGRVTLRPEDLWPEIAKAQERGQAVYAIWDKDDLARSRHPDTFEIVDAYFEPVARIAGFGDYYTRHVRRYTGGDEAIPARYRAPDGERAP